MLRERETMAEWASRLGFALIKIEGDDDDPTYRLIDKRTNMPLHGDFQNLQDVTDELRAREE